MELIHETNKASKLAPQDFISNMPDNVITNILDRLPLQDVVRTDVLSKNWRFKWTMLSQLVFDDTFFEYLLKKKAKKDYGRIISRFLLHLRGAITKFVLYIDDDDELNDVDINHWVLFLSRKGIKELSLIQTNTTSYKLPTHLFSCLELQHLEVYNFCILPPPSFHGFSNLLSLVLYPIFDKRIDVGELALQCPLLEILKLEYLLDADKVKLVEIGKLKNLKILSLYLDDYDDKMNTSLKTVFELLDSLPKLQELDLDFEECPLTESDAKKRFSTSFPSIKAVKLSIYLENGIKLSCAFELIRSFPNMQTLEISTKKAWDDVPTPATCSSIEECNTMELLHLRSVVFTYFEASENELCMIKYLLACSPLLKKIVIRLDSCIKPDERLTFVNKFSRLYRASPIVEIDLL